MIQQKPIFPCKTLPSDGKECRLLGLYPQRQEGLWMQRIKILGGILTHEQWSALAEICRRYTPPAPLLLTTRQDIEFHNVSAEAIPLLQADLAHHGLSGIGACGDTLRNITVCPGSGLCDKAPDLIPLAWALRNALESYQGIYSLPRKFKISLSACSKACAQPWINDLGFVFSLDNGCATVKLIGAGSLGPRPNTGICIEENCQPEDILPVTLAAVRLFDKHGDRTNRSKARLRHVRERAGDSQFIAMFHEELQNTKKESLPPLPAVTLSNLRLHHVIDLNLCHGGLTPDQADAIAFIMCSENIVVRPQTHHRISLFAQDAAHALEAVHDNLFLKDMVNGPDVVSCPGTTYCTRAIVNTHSVEEATRTQASDGKNVAIRISGCPNMCAQSAVADIGLIGRIKKDADGNKVEGFSVVTGGGMGKTPELAKQYSSFIAAEEAPTFINELVAKS
jgi:sulfite reductase beta subunit-like hemoprotein